MTGIAMAYEQGVFGSRPAAAGRNGYVYFATDTGELYHSNGSAWLLIAATSGGSGVSSIAKSGDTALTGAVTLTGGTNVTLTQTGNDISIAATGGSGVGAVLFDSTLGADTASIDTGAAGIAGGYNVLEVFVICRTDEAGAGVAIDCTVNNDTSAIYDRQALVGLSAAASANVTLAATKWAMDIHGSGGSAGYPGIVRMTIPGYDQTTFWKVAEATEGRPDATAGNELAVTMICGYRSTTAISRMKIAGQGAAKLKAGTRLLIFGR